MAVVPSIFGTIAESQNIQALIDTSLDALQGQTQWRKYLDLGMPSPELTFQVAIGRDRIEAAASIVDPDSPAPMRSRPGIELLTGKIPTIKEAFKMTQDDIRKMKVLQALPISDKAKKDQMLAKLWDDTSRAAVAGDKRVDIMLFQALSTLSIDVSVTNNPDGVAYGTIDLLAKAYQKQGVPTVWSNVASTPIDDIRNYVQYIWNNHGRTFGVLRMSYNNWINFMNTTQVKTMLQGFFYQGKNTSTFAVTLDNVNSFMAANQWPMIEVIQHVVGIEKDGIITPYHPWTDANVAFMPAGKVGTLANAFAVEEWLGSQIPDVSYAMFERTIISKWYDNNPIAEYTAMELNAFPAVDVDGIFLLKTDTVQASFNEVGS